jgi:predicted dehydrogenase
MRVIQVGCGQISGRWIEAAIANKDLNLVALVDIDVSSARAAAARFDLNLPIYDRLDDAIAAHTADLVFDCSPPDSHAYTTKAALSAGLHVFGEKPMAETMDQAREVRAAAQAAGTVYAVMQNRRYDPNIRAVRRFLQSGVIGDVTTVTADFYLSPHFGGFREAMDSVLLLDMSIHTFDAARMLIGADATSAICHEWNPKGSWYAHGASAVACFEMADKAVFSYRGSWCAEGLHTAWESSWRIIGERGSLVWDGGTESRCQVVRGDGGFINDQVDVAGPDLIKTDPDGWHAAAIDHFTRAVIDGESPETHCIDNFNSLAMVHGAIDSAKVGRRVVLHQEGPQNENRPV